MTLRDFESFLSARLWEDFHDANEWKGVYPRPVVGDDGGVALHVTPGYGAAVCLQYLRPEQGHGDIRTLKVWAEPAGGGWGRERVLADIEAKQQLVKLHFRRRNPDFDRDGVSGWVCAQCWAGYPCRTLRLICSPYRGHPDFRAEWADCG